MVESYDTVSDKAAVIDEEYFKHMLDVMYVSDARTSKRSFSKESVSFDC